LQKNMFSEQEMSIVHKPGVASRILLAIPAAIGWLTHKPLHLMLSKFAAHKTTGTVFYHSVLFGLYLIVYPVVLLVIVGIVALLTQNSFSWLLLLLLPFTAWCYKEFRKAKRKAD
jgi:1-acyl-sn-glycerol-3-phosphate acyltransferase